MGNFEVVVPREHQQDDQSLENKERMTRRERLIEKTISESPHYFLKNGEVVIKTLQSAIESYGAGYVLDALALRHMESFQHSIRMAALTIDIAIGERMPDLQGVALGGALHDIGKLDIPLEVLEKTNSFTSDDRAVMNQHVALGLKRLMTDPSLAGAATIPLVKEIIGGHHLHKTNEPPYPDETTLRAFGIDARNWTDETKRAVSIAATSDVYDSLAIGRKYSRNDKRVQDAKINPEVLYRTIHTTQSVPLDLIAHAIERYNQSPAEA